MRLSFPTLANGMSYNRPETCIIQKVSEAMHHKYTKAEAKAHDEQPGYNAIMFLSYWVWNPVHYIPIVVRKERRTLIGPW